MFANLDVRTIYLVLAVLSITQALLMFYVRQVHYNSTYVAEWARGNGLIALGLCLVVLSEVFSPAIVSIISYMLIIWGSMHIAFGVALVSGKRPQWSLCRLICVVFCLAYALAYSVDLRGFGGIVIFTIASSTFFGYSIYCCYSAQRDELRGSLLLVAILSAAYIVSLCIHLIGSFLADTNHVSLNSMWHSGALIVNIVLGFAQTIMLIVITSHRLQMDLQQQATHDPLTNIFNRRALKTLAERDIARSNRRGTLISVLMIDADHFKKINDAFGHAVGDAVLVAIAKKIQCGLRTEDVLARFGGEEFLVMLPDTSLKHACEVADRIRIAVSNIALPVLPDGHRFTVSIGVAERRGVQQSFDELVEMADQALYQAKKNGRNKVIGSKPTPVPVYHTQDSMEAAVA